MGIIELTPPDSLQNLLLFYMMKLQKILQLQAVLKQKHHLKQKINPAFRVLNQLILHNQKFRYL